jgi:hypothetical protein
MMWSFCMRVISRVVAATMGGIVAFGAAPAASSAAAPDWEAPFACGSEWSAGTRDGHSPTWYSVDFNGADDEGQPVLATAGGRVTGVRDYGDSSYGKHVIVDHGGGYSSLYAHLDATWVVEGQWIDQGDFIGLLGTTGGSSGPHLHFEENLNGVNQHAWFHGEKLQYGTTIKARGCGDVPAVGDWNGDRVTDLGVMRRSASPAFRNRLPDETVAVTKLGGPTDLAVTGDWDGDGVDDLGVWSRLDKAFVLRSETGALTTIPMGTVKDVPVTGDWDGDGRTEVGIFRPAKGAFRLRAADGSILRTLFGTASSAPVTGDWDGDGRTDLGVYEQGTGTWQLRSSLTGAITTVEEGGRNRLPVTGDWNGDDITDVGTWAPATATFVLRTGPAQHQRIIEQFGRKRVR